MVLALLTIDHFIPSQDFNSAEFIETLINSDQAGLFLNFGGGIINRLK